MNLSGVFAPVVTTFDRDNGELDLTSFAANLRAHMAAGLHGVLVAGSSGEAALLDASERAALVDAARDAVPRERTLIVGTGAESTRSCVQLTRDAAARGADAVLVVAPHYYGTAMTDDALLGHYRRVADESPIPVVLYSIPKYMHFALPGPVVEELATHENIVGIKDSSGNRELLAAYMKAQSETFSVLVGNAQLFQHALASGARGGILAAGLFAPAITLDVFESSRSGDTGAADAAQTRLSPLGGRIVGELGIPGIKAALDCVGLTGGCVRSPLMDLDDTRRALVQELLREAELTPA